MTDEKFMFANELKKRIDKLDDEINKLYDIFPTVRSNGLKNDSRGWIQRIKDKKIVYKKRTVELSIELSNEDIRALMDIRTAEREALMQVLNCLE